MAYVNGHQSHFRVVSGVESARSPVHLAELFMLADRAGLLRDSEWRSGVFSVCWPWGVIET